MRYLEIIPKNGSHYLVRDGQEISRHDDVKIAEAVRWELLKEFVSEAESARELLPENQNARPNPSQGQASILANEVKT